LRFFLLATIYHLFADETVPLQEDPGLADNIDLLHVVLAVDPVRRQLAPS
jgi:hypothetical protein